MLQVPIIRSSNMHTHTKHMRVFEHETHSHTWGTQLPCYLHLSSEQHNPTV